MRCISALAVGLAPLLWSADAFADIPTTDAAQLTQHSQTSSATVKLVPVTTQRQAANGGVHCAVTTGRKASVTDPTVKPNPGAGSQAIQSYAPDMPAAPDPTAQGAALNSQTLFKSTGDVAAGLDASQSTLGAAGSAFTTAGQQVGTAPTLMAAVDMNSAARAQNNLAWNSAIGSANLWVTALNTFNLASGSDASRAAIGMRTTTTPAPIASIPSACPAGAVGSGTIADPCRPASGTCSAMLVGSSSCAASGFVDANGDVLFVLLPAGNVPIGPAQSAQPLSWAEVAAALAALQSNTQ